MIRNKWLQEIVKGAIQYSLYAFLALTVWGFIFDFANLSDIPKFGFIGLTLGGLLAMIVSRPLSKWITQKMKWI